MIDLPARGRRSAWPSSRATSSGWPRWSRSVAGGRRERRAAAGRVAAVRRPGASKLAAGGARRRALAGDAARRDGVSVGDEDPGDDVTFLLAANPGLPLLPLSRVASGGELARTMLALRLVLTEAPETLVFDEVDAGIGGAAATAVGRALARLGRRHQVMSSPTSPRSRRWPTPRSW